MSTSKQIAKHLKDVYFGGNWTTVNLKDTLDDITWQEAVKKVYTLNTIATLTYHMTYYVTAVRKVLEGNLLDASDTLSFTHPPVASQKDWDMMLDKIWTEVHTYAELIEQLPDSKLFDDFSDPKYGNYYRNLTGIIEHMHYHLGQIVLIKKIIRSKTDLSLFQG